MENVTDVYAETIFESEKDEKIVMIHDVAGAVIVQTDHCLIAGGRRWRAPNSQEICLVQQAGPAGELHVTTESGVYRVRF